MGQVAARYALAGEILVAKGNKLLLDKGYGPVAPNGKVLHKSGERWRLASITKQVTAALIFERLATQARSLAILDQPLTSVFGSPALDGVTRRQMLTHHTGLANPDATTAATDGVPAFYANTHPDLKYCISKTAVAGAPFSYNNCDYILAYNLQATTTHHGAGDWPVGMRMAAPGEKGVPGYVGGKPEPAFELASWGAAGGLVGTARAVYDFDRRLMSGALLSPAALKELWKPEGNGSYQALGQWVFPGSLKGCAGPKRIVQRDGEIYGVQARNFILPDDDLVLIVFTNRGSDDFQFGEIWQGKGFVYDLLSTVACS